MARSYFWWPKLDNDIEALCKNCENCLIYKNNPNKSILNNWPWPREVWSRLHIDYLGPFLNRYFLILVDAHSKWIEAFPMTSMTSKATIDVLRSCFARFGLPRYIVSDNAPNFTSSEIEQFFKLNSIEHITSPPYHPSSNGQAENAVKSIKNSLRNALGKNECSDINKILNNFLFDFRNTVHCTTGRSPASLMFNRELRTRFNILLPSDKETNENLEKTVKGNQSKQKENYRGKRNVEFCRGEKVSVKDHRNASKPNWIKAIINKRIGKSTYLVLIPELGNVTWKRHLDQIIPMSSEALALPVNSELVDPDEVSHEKNELSQEVTESSDELVSEYGSNVGTRPKRNIRPVERLTYF